MGALKIIMENEEYVKNQGPHPVQKAAAGAAGGKAGKGAKQDTSFTCAPVEGIYLFTSGIPGIVFIFQSYNWQLCQKLKKY